MELATSLQNTIIHPTISRSITTRRINDEMAPRFTVSKTDPAVLDSDTVKERIRRQARSIEEGFAASLGQQQTAATRTPSVSANNASASSCEPLNALASN